MHLDFFVFHLSFLFPGVSLSEKQFRLDRRFVEKRGGGGAPLTSQTVSPLFLWPPLPLTVLSHLRINRPINRVITIYMGDRSPRSLRCTL